MPFSELDWESMDPPPPATESSQERGEEPEEAEQERGHSELDSDAGDIADEGAGHRG